MDKKTLALTLKAQHEQALYNLDINQDKEAGVACLCSEEWSYDWIAQNPDLFEIVTINQDGQIVYTFEPKKDYHDREKCEG